MKCGHCRTVGPAITVAHVKQCATSKGGVAVLDRPTPPPVVQQSRKDVNQVHSWFEVNALRERISEHLVREVNGTLVGYYAAKLFDEGKNSVVVKFYRVKRILPGHSKYAGRVFVDAQASGDYWPVRSPSALKLVLGAIVEDLDKAAKLYADELGRCNRCGRLLTDETSRQVGMGPECRSK